MSMDSTDCDICFHHYDDQVHLPRTLPCGHSLCSQCITDAIREDQMACPYCRRVHNITSAKDISITFALLKLSQNKARSQVASPSEEAGEKPSLPAHNLEHHDAYQPGHHPVDQPVHQPIFHATNASTSSTAILAAEEPTIHAGVCLRHKAFKLSWCTECMVWTCRDCSMMDHRLRTCRVIPIDEALYNLKQEEEVLFSSNRDAYLQHTIFLQNHKKQLEERIEKHETHGGLLRAMIESHDGTLTKLKLEKDRLSDDIEEAGEILQKMDSAKEHLMKMTTVESIESTQRELQIRFRNLQDWISRSKEEIIKLEALKLSDRLGKEMERMLTASGYSSGNPLQDAANLFEDAKKLFRNQINVENIQCLLSNRTVWAVTPDRLWASPITLHDGRVHLHSLRQASEMPPTAFTLPYEQVEGLVKEIPEIFVELSFHGEVHGLVFIILDSRADNHRGFLQRCTGSTIPSFRNTPVTSSKGCHIEEFYGGVVYSSPTFNKPRGELMSCCLGNGLVTLGTNGQLPVFIIRYKPSQFTDQTREIQLGWVTKGLEMIEAVAKNPRISEYVINDTGLVIG